MVKPTDRERKALKQAQRIGCPCIRDNKHPYRYLCLGHFEDYKRDRGEERADG